MMVPIAWNCTVHSARHTDHCVCAESDTPGTISGNVSLSISFSFANVRPLEPAAWIFCSIVRREFLIDYSQIHIRKVYG